MDCVIFSVSRGSAVLGSAASGSGLAISAADLLVDPSCRLGAPAAPGTLPAIAAKGETLGLCTTRSGGCAMTEDDLNAADTCPGPDSDGDGICDLFDPCPNVTSAAPTGIQGLKKIQLKYKATGPGGSDDGPKVVKAKFHTTAVFNPLTTHTVHVKLVNNGTGGTLFAVDLAPGAPWTQPNPLVKRWTYLDTSNALGVHKVSLVESPAGSNSYSFKIIGKDTNILDGVPLGIDDDVKAVVEIEQAGAGVCFNRTLGRCSSSATADTCKALLGTP